MIHGQLGASTKQSASSVPSSQKLPSSHSPSSVNGQPDASVALVPAGTRKTTTVGSSSSWATPHSSSRSSRASPLSATREVAGTIVLLVEYARCVGPGGANGVPAGQ
eukprot:COSAG06_NODE_13632_length_1236_cov_374.337731_1_plen_106_part_10